MNGDQYAVSALKELKNNTLLLTTANEHLTDDIFLIKIGKNISHAVEVLERDISALKKEYPGKFVSEVDTDRILEKIENAAQRMLKPDRETKDNHASGALGRDMEAYAASIRKAVEDIRRKVRGSHTDRARKGSEIGILNPFKAIFRSAEGVLIFFFKALAFIIVLGVVVFAYLFLTMEKDKAFINEVTTSSALIKEKKNQVSKLEKEKEGLHEKRNAMKSDTDNMTRVEKVAALDVEMKIKRLDDNINQLAAEISIQEKNIEDNQKKLDEFRKKSFIRRLLKQ